MLKNYFKVAVRNLLREKSYALINVLGLAIGLTICLLVMAYISDEYSFDEFHADGDRIYRLIQLPSQENDRFYAGTPFPVRPMLLENVPAIEALAQFTSSEDVIVTVDGQNFRESVNFADPEFFQLFSFELLKGSPRTALSTPNGIVLDVSGAERLFGSIDVVGKELVVTTSGVKVPVRCLRRRRRCPKEFESPIQIGSSGFRNLEVPSFQAWVESHVCRDLCKAAFRR